MRSSNAPLSTFGQRLAYARDARGISQKDLAAVIGVREKDISRWEKDHNRPRDHDTIVALANTLRVTTDFLLGATRKRGSLTILPSL